MFKTILNIKDGVVVYWHVKQRDIDGMSGHL